MLWLHVCTDKSQTYIKLVLTAVNTSRLLRAAPSMSHFLNQTSKLVLDKYKGDLDNLRKEAKHDAARERELVKEFKVVTQTYSALAKCIAVLHVMQHFHVGHFGPAFLSPMHEPACKQNHTLS